MIFLRLNETDRIGFNKEDKKTNSIILVNKKDLVNSKILIFSIKNNAINKKYKIIKK